MRTWLLKNIARLAYHYPYELFFISFLFLLVAIYGVFKLRIESSMLELLPEYSPPAITFRRALQDFGALDYMLVVIESTEPHQEQKLIQLADLFAEIIDDRTYIFALDYKLDKELMKLFQEYAEKRIVYILTDKDWEELTTRLKPEVLRKRLLMLKHRLTGAASVKSGEMLNDPIDMGELFRRRLMRNVSPTRLNLHEGYFISRDGKMLMMFVKTMRASTNVIFCENLMKFLNRAREIAMARAGKSAENLSIHFAGSHVETYYDTRIIRQDLLLTTIVSFTLVLLLFILAFRRPEAVFFVGIPLIVGIIWTLGLTSFIFGRLTMVTFSFIPVLIGLSIDFAIHIYNRFVEEIQKHRNIYAALRIAIIRTGKGIFTCALTTAVAFYCMNFTSFTGFKELGTVAGNGILCALVAIYLLFPAMLTLKWRRRKDVAEALQLGHLHLEWITQSLLKYPRLVIIFAIVLTAYLGYSALGLKFNQNIGRLRHPKPEYQKLKSRLKEQFPLPGNQVIAIVKGSSIEEVLQNNDRLFENIEQAQSTYPVLNVYSLRMILPSVVTQQKAKNFFTSLDLDKIRSEVLKEADNLGFASNAFNTFFQRLQELQNFALQGEIITFASIRNPLLLRYIQRFMVRSGNAYRVVTHIFPHEGEWVYQVPEEALRQFQRGIKEIEFTGVTILANALERRAKIDLALVVIFVLISVILITFLHFGNIKRTLMAAVPIFCSNIWMLGTMAILDIDLNFLNIIVVPMIIGLSVDYGIHLVGRYYEMRKYDIRPAVDFTGRAIVLTSLTTILCFGSLALANFSGIREMGLLAIFGIGYALFAAIIVLPAMLKIWGKHYRLSEFFVIEEGEIH